MLDETSKQRVKDLCDLIAKEQDHKRFSMLIHELNQLLDGSDGAKPDGQSRAPSSTDQRS